MTAAAFNQSVIQAFWTNMEKNKALADPRVRRAIHLAMDRHTLVEVVKDTAPMQVGGFVYPFHEMSTPRAELEKKLGYQKDIKPAVQEARRLMKEAGLRQRPQEPRLRRARHRHLQALGGGHPGHAEGAPQHRVATCAWCRPRCGSTRPQAGNFDLAISAIVSTPHGPVRHLQRLVRQGRPAELLALDEPGVPRPRQPDRARARRQPSARRWSARRRTSSRTTRR